MVGVIKIDDDYLRNYVNDKGYDNFNSSGSCQVNRNFFHYYYFLGRDFINSFKEIYDFNNNNITWFDSGCGNGNAIYSFLDKDEFLLKDYVDCISGSTLHILTGLDKLIKEYPDCNIYHDLTENVLPWTGKFDLITDVFGSAYYTDNFIGLVHTYYDSLNIGGKAFIELGERFHYSVIYGMIKNGYFKDINAIFKITGHSDVLMIKKHENLQSCFKNQLNFFEHRLF
jgi:hypothetical protein